jgi:hypothetical protein
MVVVNGLGFQAGDNIAASPIVLSGSLRYLGLITGSGILGARVVKITDVVIPVLKNSGSMFLSHRCLKHLNPVSR